jgi:hypothetical protein
MMKKHMLNKAERTQDCLLAAALFAVSFLFFFFFRNTLFSYQESTTLFIYTGEYLAKFTDKPGGLIVYLGNFLTQAYFSPFCGSFILALLNVSLWFIMAGAGNSLHAGLLLKRILFLFLFVLMLLFQSQYEHFIFYSLGFLMVAGYFSLIAATEARLLRFIYLLGLPLFYYIAGSFAVLFVLLLSCWSLIYEKDYFRFLNPLFLILAGLLSFFVFRNFLFYQPAVTLAAYPLSFTGLRQLHLSMILLALFFVFLPLFFKLTGVIRINDRMRAFLFPAFSLVLFLLLLFFSLKYRNSGLVRIIRLEGMVARQDWNGVIKQQEESPVANLIAQYYYNLALSEKGLLCERMFNAPQDFGANSLSLPRLNEFYNRSFHFYYTAGLVNEARHLAYESMVAYGYRPGNIDMLIKTELINGNFRVAEKYVNDLKKTLHYRKNAKRYQKMLYRPEAVRADSELGRKIMLLPGNDFFIRPDDRENIDLLFMSNPLNLKAFEYRLAWMLLEKDYKSAVYEIRRMKFLGYNTIPRHLEEAVAGYANISGQMPDLGGLSLRPGTERDFFEYGSAYNLHSRNKETLAGEMKKTAGKTYWYYLQFK